AAHRATAAGGGVHAERKRLHPWRALSGKRAISLNAIDGSDGRGGEHRGDEIHRVDWQDVLKPDLDLLPIAGINPVNRRTGQASLGKDRVRQTGDDVDDRNGRLQGEGASAMRE